MDLSLFKNITINGQAVVQLSLDGSVVWKKDGEEDEVKQYFNIEALEDGTIEMKHSGTNATTTMPVLEYSSDKLIWNSWDYSPISVNTGNKIYFRGVNTSFASNNLNYSTFYSTCSFNANGNIMSLLYGDDFNGQVSLSGKDYCFFKLFYNCNIVKAPILPATTLSNSCYGTMFAGCKQLTTAPELPATNLKMFCYANMFMFCKQLTTAPELPATNLASSSYTNMFYGCDNLTTIKCNARYDDNGTVITSNISSGWLYNVSSTGTFYKNPEWSGPTTRDKNTIPTGWTIVDWTDAA